MCSGPFSGAQGHSYLQTRTERRGPHGLEAWRSGVLSKSAEPLALSRKHVAPHQYYNWSKVHSRWPAATAADPGKETFRICRNSTPHRRAHGRCERVRLDRFQRGRMVLVDGFFARKLFPLQAFAASANKKSIIAVIQWDYKLRSSRMVTPEVLERHREV